MDIKEAIRKLLERAEETRAELRLEYGNPAINKLADYDCEEIFIAIHALERLEPKEPVAVGEGSNWDMSHYHCPNCGEIVYLQNFCANCGQALAWEEEEE